MRIEEGTRSYSVQNNESSQLELQECLFVIREKVAKTQLIDEELLEFTSEYYIPFALHPAVPAVSMSIADFPEGERCAGLGGEMFFWLDDAFVPWDFAFYTQGTLPRDERPPPGSYSVEDAELRNENRIPINAYSEAFLCHMGISRNYFRSPEEVPTFIGDDGQEMDLFSVVHLSKPKLVTEGVRPLRDGDEPLLEGTAGRIMKLVLEQPEVESTDVLAPIPLRSVPGATAEPPRLDATSVGSSEDADVAGGKSEAGEVDSGLKRKRGTSDDGAGTSKRVCYVSLGGSTSTEGETETPFLNVEATSDSSAPVTHAGQSPPQTSPLTADDISRRDRETGPKAFEGMPVDQLMGEFDMVTAQQAALVAQLRARFASERGQSVQKDEEILLLKTQLADAQAEAESSRSYAQKLAEEKMALLVKAEQERADAAEYKASCHWAVKYLEGGKNNHFAGLDDFRQRVEGLLEKQEEKLRKLSIEYDEELYPHMLSAIAERRWLISHGLRLAAMSTLESQEVRQSFGDVVKCALARGKAEAVEELHEKKLLTVPAAQVPGYNQNAYEELVAAMEAMKLLELPHIAQLERDQDYPIDVIMAGLTLARHATEGAEAQPDYFLKPVRAQVQAIDSAFLYGKMGDCQLGKGFLQVGMVVEEGGIAYPRERRRNDGDNSVSNQSAPSFDQLFEINELKAQSQEKDTVIKKLKERIKSLSGKINEDKIKKDLEEIETIDIELDHREKVLEITALKDDLRKLKGKSLVDNAVTKHTIDPKMLKIDMEPITLKLTQAVMSADSAVTYTSVHSEARSWSIPSEDPYEEAAQQLFEQAPRSPEYVPENHIPVYIPEPEHPEDLVPAEESNV
ncbi:hypothetical protein Tco_1393590 [Tanacetum coccineum]